MGFRKLLRTLSQWSRACPLHLGFSALVACGGSGNSNNNVGSRSDPKRQGQSRSSWLLPPASATGPTMVLLMMVSLVSTLRAQNACEKKCLDKVEGPCSGLTGKALAQCQGNCKKACQPPPPPLLEPGCTNRAITGIIRCTILQPNVRQPETSYESSVRFAPGDIVSVQADGCVQTGGSGSTWKRYVNPSGDETDTKYHGLMRIPTAFPAGSGLIRIENFIGRLQTVRGDPNVPVSELFMSLGYEDSDYSNNGYTAHDDGTDDQCKIAGINDGGPAHVTIVIYRGRDVLPSPPGSRFDFDVLPNLVAHKENKNNKDPDQLGLDHNGLLLNPSWSWEQWPANQGQSPSGSMCHDFSDRHTVAGIPTYLQPYFADCTDQTDENNVDRPQGLNSNLCGWRKGGPFATGSFVGHVNWFPVTMTGQARWGEHLSFPLGDDDYTFNFYPDWPHNQLLLAGRDALHVEFDSDETIDNFQSDEWKDLHKAVDGDTTVSPSKLFDGTTILTGLFGLDGEHDLKAELHPLYALATLRDFNHYEDNPSDEVWLMFARNRGDEGFCSSQLWDAGFEDYIVRLRWREGMTSVDVDRSKSHFVGSEGTSGPDYMIVPPGSADTEGVYVIFHLGPAASSPFMEGTVHLIWKGIPTKVIGNPTNIITGTAVARVPVVPQATAAKEVSEVNEIEHTLQKTASQLTKEQRQAVTTARPPIRARPGLHQLPPGTVQIVSAVPRNVRPTEPHAIKAGPATTRNNRDRALVKALCATTNNAPPGLPAEVCTATTQRGPGEHK